MFRYKKLKTILSKKLKRGTKISKKWKPFYSSFPIAQMSFIIERQLLSTALLLAFVFIVLESFSTFTIRRVIYLLWFDLFFTLLVKWMSLFEQVNVWLLLLFLSVIYHCWNHINVRHGSRVGSRWLYGLVIHAHIRVHHVNRTLIIHAIEVHVGLT